MSPMMRSMRGIAPPAFQPRSQPQVQPARQVPVHNYFSPHGMENAPFMEIENTSRRAQCERSRFHEGQGNSAIGQQGFAPQQNSGAFAAPQAWGSRFGNRSGHPSPQLGQPSALPQTLPSSQGPFTPALVADSHHMYAPSSVAYPLTTGPQQHNIAPVLDVKELFPELDLSADLSGPASTRSLSNSPAFTPQILSGEVTSNFNYESDAASSGVGNMLGWARRAPTIGDRSMPRLQVDTTLLAPPNMSPLHRSPSSASSAGSSARSPRRSREEMFFGDFLCGHCDAAFSTQGDLTHHLRSHAPYQSRNHVCDHCQKRFQYRKDLARHVPRHDPNRQKYYCKFKGCKYHKKGFGRQDHLDRHIQSQYKIDSPLVSRSSSNRTTG